MGLPLISTAPTNIPRKSLYELSSAGLNLVRCRLVRIVTSID